MVKPPEMVCEVIDLGKTTDGPICISVAKSDGKWKRNYTCIVCPKSCKGELTVKDDGTFETTGFDCINGKIRGQ